MRERRNERQRTQRSGGDHREIVVVASESQVVWLSTASQRRAQRK
jgi:hypothetical protein